MDHGQVDMGEGKQGRDPVLLRQLAQVVNQGRGGIARQGFHPSLWHEGEVQVLHLKQANRIDAVQRLDERGAAHAGRCATQAIQGRLSFSLGHHQ